MHSDKNTYINKCTQYIYIYIYIPSAALVAVNGAPTQCCGVPLHFGIVVEIGILRVRQGTTVTSEKRLPSEIICSQEHINLLFLN